MSYDPMLRQFHRAQIFWNVADQYFNSTVEWFGDATLLDDWPLHYTNNSLSSPCTSLKHKHEQNEKTKTLVKYPDHTFIDVGYERLRPLSEFSNTCTYRLRQQREPGGSVKLQSLVVKYEKYSPPPKFVNFLHVKFKPKMVSFHAYTKI